MQARTSFFKFLALSALLSALFFFACGKNNDDNTPGGTNPPAAGIWRITYFFDKKDETANYAGYTFEFKPDGTLIAQSGGQAWNGIWSTNCDDSANKFCIFFSVPVPSALAELEEDWRIISKTDTFMHFEHTSGGNGDTDVVHFAKQ